MVVLSSGSVPGSNPTKAPGFSVEGLCALEHLEEQVIVFMVTPTVTSDGNFLCIIWRCNHPKQDEIFTTLIVQLLSTTCIRNYSTHR